MSNDLSLDSSGSRSFCLEVSCSGLLGLFIQNQTVRVGMDFDLLVQCAHSLMRKLSPGMGSGLPRLTQWNQDLGQDKSAAPCLLTQGPGLDGLSTRGRGLVSTAKIFSTSACLGC